MILRGTLVAVDTGTYKASVQLDGSLGRRLTDIRINRGIDSVELVVGRHVALALFEDRNPRDAVLFAIWTT